jgi:hypothetical protein
MPSRSMCRLLDGLPPMVLKRSQPPRPQAQAQMSQNHHLPREGEKSGRGAESVGLATDVRSELVEIRRARARAVLHVFKDSLTSEPGKK